MGRPSVVDFGERTALVVAHPGHELRVYGLVSRAKPLVFILTDGSGRAGRSRLPASREVLTQAGARPGEIFGCFTDRSLYDALLSKNISLFVEIVARLADCFVSSGIVRVVGDALEGYNPGHDVCRLLIDAAVARAQARGRTSIENYAFCLIGAPQGAPSDSRQLRLSLTPEEFASKLNAALAYEGLDEEVRRAISESGAEAFRAEWLFAVTPFAARGRPDVQKPFYERFGEARVTSGFYQEVIRYDTHIRPLAEALEAMSTAGP